jgi:hypothetical protein
MLFIPTGLTDEFCKRAHLAALGRVGQFVPASSFGRSWEALSPEVLDEAWAISKDFN